MGTWNTSLKGNDTFLDIYQNFLESYNQGKDPKRISLEIQEDYGDIFHDHEDGNNSFFALALAQWETKSQDESILKKVKEIIETGKEIELWKELGADQKSITQRQITLNNFLEKISIPKGKPKRRVSQKFDFSSKEIVKIAAPDGKKTFTVSEHFTNGIYERTGSMLSWHNSGSAILYFVGEGKRIMARWFDSQSLEVIHDKDIVFIKKEEAFYNSGDQGKIYYIPTDFDKEKSAL